MSKREQIKFIDLKPTDLRPGVVVVASLILLFGFIFIASLNRRGGDSAVGFERGRLRLVQNALEIYEIDTGRYPVTTNSLDFLAVQPENATNRIAYLSAVPRDSWGRQYRYEFPGRHNTNSFDLSSAGPDGKFGTADDVGNW